MAVVGAVCLAGASARAGTYYWDPGLNPAGNATSGSGLGGLGIWGTAANWWDGVAADVALPTSGGPHVAVFNAEIVDRVDGITRNTFADSSTQRIQGPGTIAFLARDAVMQVDSVTVASGSATSATSATYLGGNIATDYNFRTLPGTSRCPGTLAVSIPVGATITGVDVAYRMTAASGGWMSDQTSWLRCVTSGGLGEPQMAYGFGNTGGAYTYLRTGLSIANGVIGGGSIVFELHAGRTYGGSGCNTTFNRVDNGTWAVTVHYFESIIIPPLPGTLLALGLPNAMGGSVTNAVPFAEDFENYADCAPLAGANGWFGSTGYDLSIATNRPYAYAGAYPLPSNAHSRVASLQTEGGYLHNSVTGQSQQVWVDLLMDALPSEDYPANLSNAVHDTTVFVDAQTNLVALCRTSADGAPEFKRFDGALTPGFHRLTVHLDYGGGLREAFFRLFMDGEVQQAPGGQMTPNLPAPTGTGSWFRCVNPDTTRFAGLTFCGNGFADDVVVTNSTPFGGVPARIEGDLAFGTVPTNSTATRAIVLWNDGAATLAITNIALQAGFTADPSAFDIAGGSYQAVTVTFTPSALAEYSGELCAQIEGAGEPLTLPITGLGGPVEEVAKPDVTGPDVGVRGTWLALTASATNNYPSHPVEYRFDWGNGTTSTWSSAATHSNTWQTIGNFDVRAQARCGDHQVVESPWSDLQALTITNTRVIRLTGTMAFGDVVTNTTKQLILAVHNDGSEDLVVSSITVPVGYVAVPQAFTVPFGGSSNVTVTFAPSALQQYTGTLTVNANQTSGTATTPVSGKGIETELVYFLSLTGPSAGTRTATLNYTAAASNNYGNALEYRFAWGDGGTSTWASAATQSHAWQTAGLFNVRAQARSAVTPTVTSPWSAPLALTITNTMIVRLSGVPIAFGIVVTNTMAHRTLTVHNDGTGPLNVTAVSFAPSAGYSAQPQAFTVAAGSSSNVAVVFQPTAIAAYNATLTVQADQTSGSPTAAVTGTGTDVETVTQPTLTDSPARGYGTNTQSLTFIAAASSSFGSPVEYRFDWGGGDVSGWGAGTLAHAWATVGVRTVLAQARSQTDPTKTSAWSAPLQIAIVYDPNVTFAAGVLNGKPVGVTVYIPPANGTLTGVPTLSYAPQGSSVYQPLSLGSAGGGNWTNTLPALNAGALSYHITYTLSGVTATIRYPQTGEKSYTVSSSLGEVRFTDFSGWSADPASAWPPDVDNPYTNWYQLVSGGSSRWYAGVGTVVTSWGGAAPDGGTKPCLYLRSMQGAYLLSPYLAEGVGTLYFTSSMRAVNYSGAIAVQVSTNLTTDGEWVTVAVVDYPAKSSTPLHQRASPVEVNRRDVRYVRIVRTDRNTSDTSANLMSGAIVIDNVALSYTPADVRITEELRNPGYPSRDQAVKVRCVVTDVDPSFPTVNRRVSVYYQWQSTAGAWSSTNAVHLGGGHYEGVIPQREAGIMYYYFRCDFDGYYYSRDPDGTGGAGGSVQPINVENMSPTFLPDIDEDVASRPATFLSYGIRSFRSDCSEFVLDTQPASATVPMELVGDYTWQGITLVNAITNLTWRFKGLQGYVDDATAFEATPRQWGDNDQDLPYPPIAGHAEQNATNDMQMVLEYEGFLLFRFNTVNRDYIVKRAVYQNFDYWQASQYYFEESLGLYAVKSFTNDFNVWPQDIYTLDQSRREDFSYEALDSGYETVPTATTFGWTIDDARVIDERNPTTAGTANKALQLSETSGGCVGNSGLSLTEGVQSFTYRSRATLNDTYYALNTQGFAWGLPQTVIAKMKASEISPAKAYLSTIVCYQPVFQSIGTFYEVRLIQDSDPSTASVDDELRIAVYRWTEGVPAEVARTGGAAANFLGNLIALDKTVVVDVSKDAGNTYVELAVNIDNRGAVNFRDTSANRISSGGSVGFLTFDAVPQISSLKVFSGATQLLPEITDFGTVTTAHWYWGGKRRDAPTLNRWSVAAGKLTRVVPTQTLAIYAAPANGLSVPDYSKFVVKHSGITVQSLTYAPQTESFKRWDETFVQIRCTGGDVPVVLDDPALTPWRAVTRNYNNAEPASYQGVTYDDWSDWDTQQYRWLRDELGWAVLEGWVTSGGPTGNEVQFDRSRANTNMVQALVTPVLTNGIGSIAFDYRTSGGSVTFGIERSVQGDPSSYVTVTNITVATPTATPVSFYQSVRLNFTGRIRVRVLESTSINGVLKLDGLLARDYPPRDDTTWQAYNTLITSLQTSRAFEPTALTHQTCYLNNSPRNGVASAELLDEHQPFVQTPKVGTGIGEIAFWYRAWTPGQTGRLELRVAPDQDTPEPWTFLTNLTVTSGNYQYFRVEPYDLQNKVLRIYSSTNAGMDRVCIDNVLMTEPVRAGYEFRTVSITPTQPLEGVAVEVEAEIGRFVMNPVGIRVFLSYHAGVTPWGYTNWWTQGDTSGSHKIELEQVGERLYRTPTGAQIPAFPIDAVVQYVVWGTHNTLVGTPIFQESGTFTSPAWYAPRNLSTEYAAQGWSPYYFVYSCAPGAAWINEFNYRRVTGEDTNEYVEVVGPSGVSLAGWRIDLVRYTDYGVSDTCTVAPGFRLPDPTGIGWGFFLWGDAQVRNVTQVFSVQPNVQNIPQNGGIRLVRSMGAIEHRICYGASAIAMTNSPHYYEYVGTKSAFRAAPMHLEDKENGGSEHADFKWIQPSGGLYTPGAVNRDQTLEPNVAPVVFFSIFSVVEPNGSQNVTIPPAGIQIARGGATSIVYTADSWYRIGNLATNGVTVAAASNQVSYLWSVADVQNNFSNHVAFALAPAYQTSGIPDSDMAAWLKSKSATEGSDTDGYGLSVEYGLNLNPVANDALTVTIQRFFIRPDGKPQVDFTVMNGATALTSVQSPVQASSFFEVRSSPSLASPGWDPVPGTPVYSSGDGRWIWVSDAVPAGDPYYRVVIENP